MKEIRQLPQQENRVETGPVQFGDDWPGVFIRGDNAGFYAMLLRTLLDGAYSASEDAIARLQLHGLQQLLAGAIVGPAAGMLELREMVGQQQPEPLGEPLFLLHCGAVYGGEMDDWEVEANSQRVVDELTAQYPGQDLHLYALSPDEVEAVNRHRATIRQKNGGAK